MSCFHAIRSALLVFGLMVAGCGGGSHGDLDADSVLALEIGVVSILASPNAMFPITASDALMQRVQQHEGIHRDVSAFGMMGRGRIISDGPGRLLTCRISGPVNASVEVRNGEIGLREGEIYVVEGTLLTNAEGREFSFLDGTWHEAAGSQRDSHEQAIIISVDFSEDKSKALGLFESDVMELTEKIAQLHERSSVGTNDVDALIQILADLPVTLSNQVTVKLGDIALIRSERTDAGSEVLVFSYQGRRFPE